MNVSCDECSNCIKCALKNINNKSFSKYRCFQYFKKFNELNNEIERIKEELKIGGKISAKQVSLRVEQVLGYEPYYVDFIEQNGLMIINYGFGEKKYDIGKFYTTKDSKIRRI